MKQKHFWLILLTVSALFPACQNIDKLSETGALVPPTVEEDPGLPSVFLNNTLFHAETFGNPDDPVIIVLHGGPGADYRSMLPYKELAQEGFYVVFWDQRGAGLSQRQDKDQITLDNYLEDLKQVIDHYTRSDTRQVILFGHSWGAMYATMYVNAFPQRVSKVVLCEPAAFTSDDLRDFFKKAYQPAFFEETTNDLAWSDGLISADEHAVQDYKRALVIESVSDHEQNNPARPAPHWRWGAVASIWLPQSQKDFDWTTRLGEFQGKALFIDGEWGSVHTLERQKMLAAHYPDATVVTVNNAGHDVLYQQFETCKNLIVNFLK
ncbi:MAG TPA: alpha/beta hydrolase [Saprospiraceae bacterium]|nr:alpha/beta hydrolase [Saprospiraceae bacterium]